MDIEVSIPSRSSLYALHIPSLGFDNTGSGRLFWRVGPPCLESRGCMPEKLGLYALDIVSVSLEYQGSLLWRWASLYLGDRTSMPWKSGLYALEFGSLCVGYRPSRPWKSVPYALESLIYFFLTPFLKPHKQALGSRPPPPSPLTIIVRSKIFSAYCRSLEGIESPTKAMAKELRNSSTVTWQK